MSDKLYRNIHCCKTVCKLTRYKLTVQVDSVKHIPVSTKSIVANCSKVMTLAPSLLFIFTDSLTWPGRTSCRNCHWCFTNPINWHERRREHEWQRAGSAPDLTGPLLEDSTQVQKRFKSRLGCCRVGLGWQWECQREIQGI